MYLRHPRTPDCFTPGTEQSSGSIAVPTSIPKNYELLYKSSWDNIENKIKHIQIPLTGMPIPNNPKIRRRSHFEINFFIFIFETEQQRNQNCH